MATLTHTLLPGETISHLADWYYGEPYSQSRWNQIAADNGFSNPDLVPAGHTFTLFGATHNMGSPIQTGPAPGVTDPASSGPQTYIEAGTGNTVDLYGNIYAYGPGQDPNEQNQSVIYPTTTNTATTNTANTNTGTTNTGNTNTGNTAVIAVAPIAPEPVYSNYRVVGGDNLTIIAGRFGTTVSAILAANPHITNPDLIQAGDTLKIPGSYVGAGSVGNVTVGQSSSTTGIEYRVVTFDNAAEAAAARAATAAGGFVGLDARGAYVLTGAMIGVQGITDDIADTLMVAESSIGYLSGMTAGIIAIGEHLRQAGSELQVKVDDVTGYHLQDTSQPTTSSGSAGQVTYQQVIVQPGDNLSTIAATNGITLAVLLANNPQFQANPGLIHPGDVVHMPDQTGTTIITTSPNHTNTTVTPTGTPGVSNQPGPSYSQVAPTLPQLSWGSMGQTVRLLQQALNILNHAGLVEDGDFGPATNTAVHNYQGLNGLVVDGVVGAVTWNHILNGLAATGNTSLANQLAAAADNPSSGPGTGGPTTISNPGVNTGSSGAVNASVDQFMAGIRHVESSGNYSAVGPDTAYGPARGAYQFVQDTWNRAISTYAPQYSNYIGSNVAGVPAHVQDAVARAWFNGLYRRYGSWELVAVAHFAGEGRADDAQRGADVWAISDVLGTSIAGYVQKVLAAMGAAPATNPGVTAINNPGGVGPTNNGANGIGIGTNGLFVEAIQEALNALIHSGLVVDGAYGPLTAGAVSDYQSQRGLTVTGTVNAETYERILSELRGDYFNNIANELESQGTAIFGTGTTTDPGVVIDGPGGVPPVYLSDMPTLNTSTPGPNAGVRLLQEALTALGFPLTPDGWFGTLTQQALEAFQNSRNLAPSGSTTISTWEAIATALQTVNPGLVTRIQALQGTGTPGGTTPGGTGPGFNITGSLTVDQFVDYIRAQNVSVFNAEVDDVHAEMSVYLSSPPADVVAAQAAYNIFTRGGVSLPLGTFARVYTTLSTYIYVVNHGDSLSGIAAALGTTVSKIANATGIDPNSTIHPGDVLIITNPPIVPDVGAPPDIDVPQVSQVTQILKDLPLATLVDVLEEFFAHHLYPTDAAIDIAAAMTGLQGLTFEQAVQQANLVDSASLELTSRWLPIISDAALSAFTWAFGQTGSHVTAAEVAHLVAFEGLSRTDALAQAQIPEVPEFVPQGATPFEQIDYTASLIAQFETGNVPGGQVTGAYLAQMRATLTDLLSQVTDNNAQIEIAKVLLNNGWDADEAVAIAVIWNRQASELSAAQIVAMLSRSDVRGEFNQAQLQGASLQGAALAAYNVAIEGEIPGVDLPTQDTGDLPFDQNGDEFNPYTVSLSRYDDLRNDIRFQMQFTYTSEEGVKWEAAYRVLQVRFEASTTSTYTLPPSRLRYWLDEVDHGAYNGLDLWEDYVDYTMSLIAATRAEIRNAVDVTDRLSSSERVAVSEYESITGHGNIARRDELLAELAGANGVEAILPVLASDGGAISVSSAAYLMNIWTSETALARRFEELRVILDIDVEDATGPQNTAEHLGMNEADYRAVVAERAAISGRLLALADDANGVVVDPVFSKLTDFEKETLGSLSANYDVLQALSEAFSEPPDLNEAFWSTNKLHWDLVEYLASDLFLEDASQERGHFSPHVADIDRFVELTQLPWNRATRVAVNELAKDIVAAPVLWNLLEHAGENSSVLTTSDIDELRNEAVPSGRHYLERKDITALNTFTGLREFLLPYLDDIDVAADGNGALPDGTYSDADFRAWIRDQDNLNPAVKEFLYQAINSGLVDQGGWERAADWLAVAGLLFAAGFLATVSGGGALPYLFLAGSVIAGGVEAYAHVQNGNNGQALLSGLGVVFDGLDVIKLARLGLGPALEYSADGLRAAQVAQIGTGNFATAATGAIGLATGRAAGMLKAIFEPSLAKQADVVEAISTSSNLSAGRRLLAEADTDGNRLMAAVGSYDGAVQEMMRAGMTFEEASMIARSIVLKDMAVTGYATTLFDVARRAIARADATTDDLIRAMESRWFDNLLRFNPPEQQIVDFLNAVGKAWDDASMTLEETIALHKGVVRTSVLTPAGIRTRYDSGLRFNPASKQFERPRDGVVSLPSVGTAAEVAAQIRAKADALMPTFRVAQANGLIRSASELRTAYISQRERIFDWYRWKGDNPNGTIRQYIGHVEPDIGGNLNNWQGNLGEMLADQKMLDAGWIPGHQLKGELDEGLGSTGLDHVYFRVDGDGFVTDAVVMETKTGGAWLGTTVHGNQQMSQAWIEGLGGEANRLEDALTADAYFDVGEIGYRSVLATAKYNGDVSFTILDGAGADTLTAFTP